MLVEYAISVTTRFRSVSLLISHIPQLVTEFNRAKMIMYRYRGHTKREDGNSQLYRLLPPFFALGIFLHLEPYFGHVRLPYLLKHHSA